MGGIEIIEWTGDPFGLEEWLLDGVDIAISLGRDSWLDKRRSILIACGLVVVLYRASSSKGSGKGAVQSVSANEVGRPVITANLRSTEHRAHQTRYLISLGVSSTSLLSFRRLSPRVVACRIAMPLATHDLDIIRDHGYKTLPLSAHLFI